MLTYCCKRKGIDNTRHSQALTNPIWDGGQSSQRRPAVCLAASRERCIEERLRCENIYLENHKNQFLENWRSTYKTCAIDEQGVELRWSLLDTFFALLISSYIVSIVGIATSSKHFHSFLQTNFNLTIVWVSQWPVKEVWHSKSRAHLRPLKIQPNLLLMT